jgi:hypothetical protein
MISSDMSEKAAHTDLAKSAMDFPVRAWSMRGGVIGSPFSIYRDEGVGVVPVPGIYGALRNFKSIHGLYSCNIRESERSRRPSREKGQSNGPSL